jgi:hypothetical protein
MDTIPQNPGYEKLTAFGKCVIDSYTRDAIGRQQDQFGRPTIEQAAHARAVLRDMTLAFVHIEDLAREFSTPQSPYNTSLRICLTIHGQKQAPGR